MPEKINLMKKRFLLTHSVRVSAHGDLTLLPLGCGKAVQQGEEHMADFSPNGSQEADRQRKRGCSNIPFQDTLFPLDPISSSVPKAGHQAFGEQSKAKL
jgi:hypothetical protein